MHNFKYILSLIAMAFRIFHEYDGTGTPAGRTGLRNRHIAEGETEIRNNAFLGYTNLNHVTLPDSLVTIGVSAFSGCTNLHHVTLPNSLVTIGESAFSGCERLRSILLPPSLQKIGKNAFLNCTSLPSLRFPDSLTHIDNGAFNGCKFTSFLCPLNLHSLGDEDGYSPTNAEERDAESVFGNNGNLNLVVLPSPRNRTNIKLFMRISAFRNSPGLNTLYGLKGVENILMGAHVDLLKNEAWVGDDNSEIKTITLTDEQDFKILTIEAINHINKPVPLGIRSLGSAINN